MSARNRGPPGPAKGVPHGGLPQPPVHEPHFPRVIRGPPHPALHEEVREAHYSLSGPRQLHPHPVIIEERLAVQHDDIQALLVDNQRLAATHVALKQELEVTQYELQRADKYAQTQHAEKDLQMRELYEKSVKMENDLNAVNAMRSELMQVHMDIKDLTAARQDLTAQVQMMTQDLGRVTSDLQQVPTVKAEIEGLRHELERVRPAIEHEKKSFAESFEHGKVMESKLITMAREMEKLRAELANAEKRAPAAAAAAAAAGNPGVSYNPNYVNPESGYPGNPYPVGYGMMPTNSMQPAPAGGEGYPPYGPGAGAWGYYDPQRAQGSR
ncbi:structural maintenance of chromosomes domain protein [Perilla frutescens var. hirtella]|uniref:Structural maintenance of chromosomes domain protein n=1 Tax=Perilla frutescens var. hirtella TaxID=608512 RepID=A0AAD4JM29_PERFH|nr:structural maintenance of chromosomes domain protein [Perilla frutescens var. frutescens]KAH6775523.1 structural maintenance of chromosomes domain protein [Perilla frutescens var. hirtella]KAH6836345.1 structural maintenance of chromosomes domain protein [Perilla frutescens var. hirtella]